MVAIPAADQYRGLTGGSSYGRQKNLTVEVPKSGPSIDFARFTLQTLAEVKSESGVQPAIVYSRLSPDFSSCVPKRPFVRGVLAAATLLISASRQFSRQRQRHSNARPIILSTILEFPHGN
jgi:hypothetical protein